MSRRRVEILVSLSVDLFWMNHFDTRIARKAGSLERENRGKAMNPHRRDKTGVVGGLPITLCSITSASQTG
jgi:hypothetical protein